MWSFIFLLAAMYCGYYMVKNYRAANQSLTTITVYCQMLYSLMKKHKFKEEDYKKLITEVWEVDSNLLDYREFNKKWGKICQALQIQVQYNDTYKTDMSEKVIPFIAARMYDNRHLFEQYGEQSERSRKMSEDILNDPKYRY